MAGLRGRCTGRELHAAKGRRNRKQKLVGKSEDEVIRFYCRTARPTQR